MIKKINIIFKEREAEKKVENKSKGKIFLRKKIIKELNE